MIKSILCLLSAPSFAAFSGPYIEADAGLSYLRGEYKLNKSDQKTQVNNISYVFGFKGGYLYNFENTRVICGGDFGATYPGNTFSKSSLSVSGNLRYIMNASLLSGYIMNPRTALVMRIGTGLTSIALKTQNKSESKTTQSFIPGVSLFYKVSEHFWVSATYTLSMGRKVSSKDGSGSYQPRQHAMTVGVVYAF